MCSTWGSFFGSPNVTFAEPFLIWDKFDIYQVFKAQSVSFHIGKKPGKELIEKKDYVNPIKQGLWYKQLLDEGRVNTQEELAWQLGVSRSRVASMLRMLKLDEEIKEFILSLDDGDERLKKLTERRLRPLLETEEREIQRKRFREIID